MRRGARTLLLVYAGSQLILFLLTFAFGGRSLIKTGALLTQTLILGGGRSHCMEKFETRASKVRANCGALDGAGLSEREEEGDHA